LLVKSMTPYRRPPVLAAIDPTHAHAKPGGLDHEILDYGAQLGRALRGALHVVHAYMPRPLPPMVTFDAKRREGLLSSAERDAKHVFDGALVKMGVPAKRRHLVRGEPAAAIPATARKTRSAIVVMGAVSRSALRRLFVGSTALRVMDELRCDLLIVKPPKTSFKGPRARRGVRLFSPVPQL